MSQLLSALENVGRILCKYGKFDVLPEVNECKRLIGGNKYEGFLERINSSKWWGKGSISDLEIFSSFQMGSEYEDAASFQESLLCIAKILKEHDIENQAAEEWVFRAESWPYKT